MPKMRRNFSSIIEVEASDARDFFLRTENYFNNELPKYIDFSALLSCISDSYQGKFLSSICQKIKPEHVSNVNYPIITNRDGKFAWRQLDFVNPVIYVALVHLITEKENWKILQDRFKLFEDNGIVQCHSIPIWTRSKSNKAINISKWWNNIEQNSISLSMTFESAIATDVVDCYGSLYTHAVSWAIHGKEEAKSKKNDKSILGNKIDYHIRANRFGQTNGIPQGSALSDFIAELVLGYLDCEIAEQIKLWRPERSVRILRFRDDYRIFARNSDDTESALLVVSNALRDVGMRLGANKTNVSSNPVRFALKSDKIFDIENLNFKFDKKTFKNHC